MKVQVGCPQCGKQYQVGQEAVGKSVRCKNCGASFRIGAPSRPAASTATSGGVAQAGLPRQPQAPAPPQAEQTYSSFFDEQLTAPLPAAEAPMRPRSPERRAKRNWLRSKVRTVGNQYQAVITPLQIISCPGIWMMLLGGLYGVARLFGSGIAEAEPVPTIVSFVLLFGGYAVVDQFHTRVWTDFAARELRGNQVIEPRWMKIAPIVLGVPLFASFAMWSHDSKSEEIREDSYQRYASWAAPEDVREVVDQFHDECFDECYVPARRRRSAKFDESKYRAMMDERVLPILKEKPKPASPDPETPSQEAETPDGIVEQPGSSTGGGRSSALTPRFGEGRNPSTPPVDLGPVDAATIDRLLADLASGNIQMRGKASVELTRMQPTAEHRAAVMETVFKLMDSGDPVATMTATQIIKRWASPQNAVELARRLPEANTACRQVLFELLEQFADPQTAPLVAKMLPQSQLEVTRILEAIGSPAEESVHPYLNHPNLPVAIAACRLLGRIGTERSIPALTAIANGQEFAVAGAARMAVEQIRRRH